jgi:hypothetical protein
MKVSTLSKSKEEHKESCKKFVEKMRLESSVSPEDFLEIMINHVYETAYLKGEWDESKRQKS